MVNRLSTAATRLIDRALARGSETVLYRRGATDAAGLSAVLGASDHEGADQFGQRTLSSSKDFVFKLSDLVTALTALSFERPEDGDEIEWNGMIHAVLPFRDDYCWTLGDPFEASIIVHTKETTAVV